MLLFYFILAFFFFKLTFGCKLNNSVTFEVINIRSRTHSARGSRMLLRAAEEWPEWQKEEGIEVCPVTIAEELLAMQIDALQGGGNDLHWQQAKTLKRYFPDFSPKKSCKAKSLGWKWTALYITGAPRVPSIQDASLKWRRIALD